MNDLKIIVLAFCIFIITMIASARMDRLEARLELNEKCLESQRNTILELCRGERYASQGSALLRYNPVTSRHQNQ